MENRRGKVLNAKYQIQGIRWRLMPQSGNRRSHIVVAYCF